jgi:hypothetical protein
VTGGWRILHNEDLYDFNLSPKIIKASFDIQSNIRL